MPSREPLVQPDRCEPRAPSRPGAVIVDDHFTPYRVPLFSALSALGHDIRVLYCVRTLPERDWRMPDELPYSREVLGAWRLRIGTDWSGYPRDLLIPWSLPLRLWRLSPAVVVGYAFSLPTLIAFVYAKLLGKRFVSWSTVTPHTEDGRSRMQRIMRRMVIPRADACVTPSVDGRDFFVEYGAKRVIVAVQSADVDFFSTESDAARGTPNNLRNRLDLPGPVILQVGSLTPRKGIAPLLHLFARLAGDYPTAGLLIAGTGPLRKELAETARTLGLTKRVRFLDHVDQRELPAVYAAADIFVLMSLADTFGVVVAEAAASGLPIMCSRYAGAASVLVQDGRNGFVIDPKDTADCEQRLRALLSDKPLRLRMGAASREIARQCDAETVARSFALALGEEVA